jgi:hypothetical protein
VIRLASLAASVCLCLLAGVGRAEQINLGSLTCDQYETTIMNPPAPPASAASAAGVQAASNLDAVDVVMWLFGFAVAKSGAQVMYGDALQQFGNALDSECKIHPNNVLLDAVSAVKIVNVNPMDLTTLGCTIFEARHMDMEQSDPQSAATIMMWLFGFSVGKSGGHVLDPGGLTAFSAALANQCTLHPQASLFDAVTMVKPAKHR